MCLSIAFLSVALWSQWSTEAFQTTSVSYSSASPRTLAARSRITLTKLNVLAEPPREISSTQKVRQGFPKSHNSRKGNFKRSRNSNYNKKEDVWSSGRWNKAIQVEKQLLAALEVLEHAIKQRRSGKHDEEVALLDSLAFPPIRDCNAALAAFGDGENLLRALRLYFKMRTAASLNQRYYPKENIRLVPTPTLVTFSTLMSRAVQLGKSRVAIRLWNIMRRQPDFFSAYTSAPQSRRIIPDVKAANILMNCYAKLGYVESAQDLLQQMITGDGEDVPLMEPNIVSFNTLLDACLASGELDVALSVKKQIEEAGIALDARTYTTLIATVARKPSSSSGVNDPTLAFSLLQEMQSLDIRPNGITYSALIDVCGRCRRNDLALKGLRLMADQKAEEHKLLNYPPGKRHTLPAEVGAWTAAINSCGKTGKIESALKLFYAMPNFGVDPNTVTCGCLVDCLLRQGRTADSLEVLRYMKKHRIAPSEVMYTSLMTSASRLAQFENARQNTKIVHPGKPTNTFPLDESGATPAVEVYTELMTSLMQLPTKKNDASGGKETLPLVKANSDGSDELYRVSLVFKEMKAAGVEPDLACYNALLKSCANAGDVDRASEVLEQIRNSDKMDPNDKTWREMIRAAGKANRIDVALSTWKVAIKELNEAEEIMASDESRLSAQSAVALLEALVNGLGDAEIDRYTRLRLYKLVADVCEAVILGSSYLGMNLVDRRSVLDNPRAMIIFLHALVALEHSTTSFQDNTLGLNRMKLRLLAVSIVAAGCFERGLPYRLRQNDSYVLAYQTAAKWWNEERCRS
jgi:pentatricopeptide repeat protein